MLTKSSRSSQRELGAAHSNCFNRNTENESPHRSRERSGSKQPYRSHPSRNAEWKRFCLESSEEDDNDDDCVIIEEEDRDRVLLESSKLNGSIKSPIDSQTTHSSNVTKNDSPQHSSSQEKPKLPSTSKSEAKMERTRSTAIKNEILLEDDSDSWSEPSSLEVTPRAPARRASTRMSFGKRRISPSPPLYPRNRKRKSKSRSEKAKVVKMEPSAKKPKSSNIGKLTRAETWKQRDKSKLSMTFYELPDENVTSEEYYEPDVLTTPVMIVVDPSLTSPKKFNERIEIVPQFVPSLPKQCGEGRRGEKYGTFSRMKERRKAEEKFEVEYPGIPDIKYGKADNEKMQLADRNAILRARNPEEIHLVNERIANKTWTVQALFECQHDPSRCTVLYEGWSSETMSAQQTDQTYATAPEIAKFRQIREKFLAKMKEEAEVEAQRIVAEKLAEGVVITLDKALETIFVNHPVTEYPPTSRFWLYRDLEYYHTKHQEEHMLGPLWYISMRNPEHPPPCYAYTAINIVEKEAFDLCRDSLASLTTEELIEMFDFNAMSSSSPAINETCSNPEGCKCNLRFDVLYRGDRALSGRHFEQPLKNLMHNSQGLLDLGNDFALSDLRVILECSDECGCDDKCPRRKLQQGQAKPMVVYHEGAKGFGLRAAEGFKKGELVCEYTGTMFVSDDTDDAQKFEGRKSRGNSVSSETSSNSEKKAKPPKKRNTSYQAGFSVFSDDIVICAAKVGNMARFINHSCDGNTAFFEVHSRRYVADPLIPRIAVYATKDIALGEEITIAYWDPTQTMAKSGIPCRCGSAKCMKYLPS